MALIDASNYKRNALSNIQSNSDRELMEYLMSSILNLATKFDLDNSNHMALLCEKFDEAREYFSYSPKYITMINEFETELYL